nr:hypothetical protein BaRGS_011989 [Batillaria attramentaria]
MMWKLVLFSDESRFLVKPRDGRIRVWRRPGEQLADDAVQEVTAFGDGSVMVRLDDRPAVKRMLFQLLDLVDRYWNGSKSLHQHAKFLGLALDVVDDFSKDGPLAGMQSDVNVLKQRVERLQEENTTLRERQSRQRSDHDTTTASEVQLKVSLKQACADVERLREELQHYVKENSRLQRKLDQQEVSVPHSGSGAASSSHSIHLAPDRAAALRTEVAALLAKQAIELVNDPSSPGYYSHMFVVPKPGGRWRPIIDLSRLNLQITAPHFRMETARALRQSILPGDYARTSSSLSSYLDDILLKNLCPITLQRDLATLRETLTQLGWIVNLQKSDLIPSQRFVHLDALTFSWTDIDAYVFPPFPLVAKIVSRLPLFQCDLTLIAPLRGVSLIELSKAVGWSQHTTFGRFYLRLPDSPLPADAVDH